MLELCKVTRTAEKTQLEFMGARAEVSESWAHRRAVHHDRNRGTRTAHLVDFWAYFLPGWEHYTHPTREGAEKLAARHLVQEMRAELPEGNESLSIPDRCQLARIIARRAVMVQANHEPRVGDFVQMPDGTRERLVYGWPVQETPVDGEPMRKEWQTFPGGSFHLVKWGSVSHSGSCNETLPGSDRMAPMGQAVGRFWIWRDGISGAHRGVDVFAPATVWELMESGA